MFKMDFTGTGKQTVFTLCNHGMLAGDTYYFPDTVNAVPELKSNIHMQF